MISAPSWRTLTLHKGYAPPSNGGYVFMGREPNKIQALREEMRKLMTEQLDSLKAPTFGGLDEEAMRLQDARLKRIREVSADFIAALKYNKP